MLALLLMNALFVSYSFKDFKLLPSCKGPMPPTENSLLSALGGKPDQLHAHEHKTLVFAGEKS